MGSVNKPEIQDETQKGANIMIKCTNGNGVIVLSSAAGMYIGTVDEDGFPNCRISGYYKKTKDAQKDLDNVSFAFRDCMENSFCNDGKGCRLVKEEM